MKGDGAPKSANPNGSRSEDRAYAFRRDNRGVLSAPDPASHCSSMRIPQSRSSSAKRGSAPRSQIPASFSRGLVVVPGGGSGAARRSHCGRDPQAPHPVPPTLTPRENALQRTRYSHFTAGLEGGYKAGIAPAHTKSSPGLVPGMTKAIGDNDPHPARISLRLCAPTSPFQGRDGECRRRHT